MCNKFYKLVYVVRRRKNIVFGLHARVGRGADVSAEDTRIFSEVRNSVDVLEDCSWAFCHFCLRHARTGTYQEILVGLMKNRTSYIRLNIMSVSKSMSQKQDYYYWISDTHEMFQTKAEYYATPDTGNRCEKGTTHEYKSTWQNGDIAHWGRAKGGGHDS